MFTVRVTRHLNAIGTVFMGYTCKLCSLRGCWHRERLLSLYRGFCWRPGCFVSLTMGCVVVTEPFELTVVGARHPFTVANRMQTHIGSICVGVGCSPVVEGVYVNACYHSSWVLHVPVVFIVWLLASCAWTRVFCRAFC